MTEVEQLRKEVNELRERIAMLEARPAYSAPPFRLDWSSPQQPTWVSQSAPHLLPGTVIC